MLGSTPPPADAPSPVLGVVPWERPGAVAAAAPALVAVSGGGFVLAWESRADGDPAIRVSRREPGGAGAWSAPIRLDALPAAEASAGSLEPRLAAGPADRVAALWQDGRSGPPRILGRGSRDGGRSWDPDVWTVSDGPGPATMPSVVASPAGVLLAAWEDGRDGDRDLRVRRSLDGGWTWEPSRRADSDAPGAASSFHPQWIAPGRDMALLLWWDDRSGLTDLYVRRSTDGGGTWDGPEVRLDEGAPGLAASHEARWEPLAPGATKDGPPRIAVVWEELPPGETPRRLHRASLDLGITWGPAEEDPPAGAEDSGVLRAVAAGGDTLVVRARPAAGGQELRATLRRGRHAGG